MFRSTRLSTVGVVRTETSEKEGEVDKRKSRKPLERHLR